MEDHGLAWVSETSRGKASPGPRPLKGWRSRKVQGSRKMVFQKMARVPRIGGGRDTMTKGQTLTQDRTQNLERESARWGQTGPSSTQQVAQKTKQSPQKTQQFLTRVTTQSTQCPPRRIENTSTQTCVHSPQASTAARLMTATRPTQPSDHTCPSTRECPSTKKRGEALTFITTWRDPENTMLSESSRHRRTHTVRFHWWETSRTGRSTDTEWGSGSWGLWFFWGDRMFWN